MANNNNGNKLVLLGIGVVILYFVFKPSTCPDEFSGQSRFLAKTSIAHHQASTVTIPQLYNELPSDEVMKVDYGIKKNSPRCDLEDINLSIICWLYTYKYEDDGDYHLIVGSSKNKDQARYFSAEISGLPKKGSINYQFYDRLKKAREEFYTVIDGCPVCQKKYYTKMFDTPIKVKITGSLYWDIDHSGNSRHSGTGDFSSESCWEIHPVTEIEVLQ